MPKSREYRQHAQECVTPAERSEIQSRKSRLQMAEAWLDTSRKIKPIRALNRRGEWGLAPKR